MRRAAEEIVDPGPGTVDPVWDFFGSACAYCGRGLDRERREGQTDHAAPEGGNHIGNLVLACSACNGDEKREMGWRKFLRLKNPDEATYERRAAQIDEWFSRNPRAAPRNSEEVVRLRSEIEDLIAAFGAKCAELKSAVAQTSRKFPA